MMDTIRFWLGRHIVWQFTGWACDKHCADHHNADFAVCPRPLCRLSMGLEEYICPLWLVDTKGE